MKPFQQSQYALAAHLRNPQQNPAPPGIEDRCLVVYRDLFYRNIESFIANGFPVLRSLTDDSHWHAMVRDFFTLHRCESPFFLDIAREFIAYLEQTRGEVAGDPPFLLELAHYEWVELAMEVNDEPLPKDVVPNGDLRDQVPVLTPWMVLLSYAYPVQLIGPDYRPQLPPETPTFLLVYRDQGDGVHFLVLNPLTARLIELLNGEQPGYDALEQLASESGHAEPAQLIDYGLDLLTEWRHKGIILGTRSQGQLPQPTDP